MILVLSLLIIQGCFLEKSAVVKKPTTTQASATIEYKSITDVSWKLTATSDASLSITDSNYLVYSFSKDGKGNILKVYNGETYQTPVATFTFTTSEADGHKTIVVRFDVSALEEDAPPVTYTYELAKTLVLTESASGKTYTFSAITDTNKVVGYTQCTGSFGDFDIYVYGNSVNPDKYSFYITPYQVSQEGDIGSVHIANANGEYKTLRTQLVFKNGVSEYFGELTKEEVEKFDLVDITSFTGEEYAGANPEKYTTCRYNISGDGSRN